VIEFILVAGALIFYLFVFGGIMDRLSVWLDDNWVNKN